MSAIASRYMLACASDVIFKQYLPRDAAYLPDAAAMMPPLRQDAATIFSRTPTVALLCYVYVAAERATR